jgi:hypothetical protein
LCGKFQDVSTAPAATCFLILNNEALAFMRKIRHPLYFSWVIHPHTVVLIQVKQKAMRQEATLRPQEKFNNCLPCWNSTVGSKILTLSAFRDRGSCMTHWILWYICYTLFGTSVTPYLEHLLRLIWKICYTIFGTSVAPYLVHLLHLIWYICYALFGTSVTLYLRLKKYIFYYIAFWRGRKISINSVT